ncbi:hypothetical protein O5154_28820, partial [Escherichia coli]|nr:hypothetical protein [Escherichia coli]
LRDWGNRTDRKNAKTKYTLERVGVEQQSLLSHPANWLTLQRLNDTQYEARVPVSNSFAPNITFSVLYTRNGQYSFQNAGIKVAV